MAAVAIIHYSTLSLDGRLLKERRGEERRGEERREPDVCGGGVGEEVGKEGRKEGRGGG